MADFPPVIKLVFEDNSCTVDVYIIFVRNLNAPNVWNDLFVHHKISKCIWRMKYFEFLLKFWLFFFNDILEFIRAEIVIQEIMNLI